MYRGIDILQWNRLATCVCGNKFISTYILFRADDEVSFHAIEVNIVWQ
jgi:hypothetical protein